MLKTTLTLAVDFDGVIADSDSAKLKYAREELGLDVNEEQVKYHYFTRLFGEEKGHELYMNIIRTIYHTERMMAVPLVPNAADTMAGMQAAGWKFVVVTSRNGSPYVEGSSAYWAWKLMAENKIEIDKKDFINTDEASKLDACLSVNAIGLLDDDYSKLQPVIEGGLRGLLFSTRTNRHAEQEYSPFLATRIRDWNHLGELVLDSP